MHAFFIGIDEAGRPHSKSGRASSRHYKKFLIGIDEAGRGPLAGPVVVAGIRLATCDMRHATRFLRNIKDSKKLTAKQREEWYNFLTSHPKIKWATAIVSHRTIDQINIAQATNLGAFRVYKKLNNVTSRFHSKNNIVRACREHTLLDGGLKLPPHISHESIIKGDEKIPAISAASIIAKVTRDRIMMRLHKKYPKYGFDIHKGYGTEFHRKRIKKFGRCDIHRVSFRVKFAKI